MSIASKVASGVIGLLPFAVLLVWLFSDSFDVPSPLYMFAPLAALIAGVSWFRDYCSLGWTRAHSVGYVLALLLLVCRVDWVVSCLYSCIDSPTPSYQTYIAPSAPIWSPPTPAVAIPGAKSWDDFQFFYHGGGGGPVTTPALSLNWFATVSRFWVYALGVHILLTFLRGRSETFEEA